MGTEVSFSPTEFMAYRTAKELSDSETVFVGIGLPLLAASLARATHAPNLLTIFESGVFGAIPNRLPVSVADPAVVPGSLSVTSVGEVFQNYLQGGLIDIGLLSGAQIDRFGNLNSTVIGPYEHPQDRLPGSGGACEIALHSKKLIIVIPMTPRTFVSKCDFITTPGHFFASEDGKTLTASNSSPHLVITNMGVFEFLQGEMILTELCPGADLESIKSICKWPIKISESLKNSEGPNQAVIALLKNIDSQRIYV